MDGFTDKIEWIVAGIVGFGAATVAVVRVIVGRSEPCDKEMKAFKERIEKDLDEVKAAMKHAIRHAEDQHNILFTKIGTLDTAVAVLDARMTNLQDRVRKIDNGRQ